jgi:hypothetical protein
MDLESHPPVELGTRSVWRGVPFQEVLLHPLRSRGPSGAELLGSIEFRVIARGAERLEALPRVDSPPGVSQMFANPGDVEALFSTGTEPSRNVAAHSIPSRFEGQLSPKMRVAVTADGVYRIDRDYLLSNGFDAAGLDPRNFHLTCRGVELPILLEGEGDGVFNSGDAIVFYGQKCSVKDRDIWNGGDFTDSNVYWLYADNHPGLRMAQVSAAPTHSYPEVAQFPCSTHFEENTTLNDIGHFRPDRDVWFWGSFYGGSPGDQADHSVPVVHPASGSCQVSATVAGAGSIAHAVRLRLNGSAPSSGPDPANWTGNAILTETWGFSSGLLDGSNTLSLSTTGSDYQIPDCFEIQYQRTLQAEGDALLLTVPASSTLFRPFGFGSSPYVLDLSSTDAASGIFLPRQLTGVVFSDTPETGTAAFEALGTRFALSSSPLLPDSVEVASERDLSSPALRADLLIITHPDFHPAGLDTDWQAYLARRRTSMEVEVVDVQDIYDNFSFGIFDPSAIRTFLQAARGAWAKPPSSILLIGDGTYDYKDYKNQRVSEPAYKNWVPTMLFEDVEDSAYLGHYPSDAWFADTDGEGYPEMAVGRIPCRDYTTFAGILQKIAAYEDQPLTGNWYKSALYVGDTWTEPWEQLAFEGFNNHLQTTFTPPPWSNSHIYFHSPPYNGTDSNACAAAIRTDFPTAGLVHFAGHSGFQFWGKSLAIFSSSKIRNSNTASDIDLLPHPTSSLPFVVNSNCYSTAFDEVGFTCLMEEALNRPDRGAIGSVGASTIAYVDDEEAFATTLFTQAFGRPKVRTVGDLVEAGRFSLPTFPPRTLFHLVLLGDPTLRLRLPAPPAPAGLSGVSGNASVDLGWAAPLPAASGCHVYRSDDGGVSWIRLTATPLPPAAISHHDGGLVNMHPYRYYLTSLDVEGFEGPPSLQALATPSNPAPPAVPQGLAISDPGLETVLNVSWLPNAESDLQAYVLAWGILPGVYTEFTEIPAGTTTTIVQGLILGQTYYFGLKARNTSLRESAYGSERSGHPTGIKLAVRPPAAIMDLKITKEEKDLLLTWSQPTLDIGGQPVSVTGYTVYRVHGVYDWNMDQVGAYSPYDLVVQIPDSKQTTWLDQGAVNLPAPLTYLVVAHSAEGRSPASNPPPAPVLSLRAERSQSTGHTLLTFTPVTQTIQGTPCLVDHYKVYGFYPMDSSSDHVSPDHQIFPVGRVEASLLPRCEGTAVFCDASPNPAIFYTVVAVDRRGNTSLY